MGTTHPAQLQLVSGLFTRYAHPIIYPAKQSGRFCWRIVCDLNSSFNFLISKPKRLDTYVLQKDELFYAALAGFADAEGYIGLRELGKKVHSRFTLSNRSKVILSDFQQGLKARGLDAKLYALRGKGGRIQWQLEVHEQNALRLLPLLKLRHGEKLTAKNIVLQNHERPWPVAGSVYKSFRSEVREERNACIQAAQEAYLHRGERKERRSEELRKRMLLAYSLRNKGSSIAQIGRALGCSQRTVYRWLSRYE